MKIAIASGKGGTGKTTLSTNLASYWSSRRQVALVDLDVEEPNSGIFIGGDPVHEEPLTRSVPVWNAADCSRCGNCQAVCEFHAVIKMGNDIMVFPELCHGCFACSELCPTGSLPMVSQEVGSLRHRRRDNLDFIEGRLAIGEEQAVPAIKQTQDYVARTIPPEAVTIIDAPPGTSCPVIEVVKKADFVVLITEPTPFGLNDLGLAVGTVRELGVPFGVVVNRDGVGDDGVERYCEEEGVPIIARIPQDRAIAGTYSAGRLLYPEHPSVRDALETIINYIENIQSGAVVS